jgi:hypothetical protein
MVSDTTRWLLFEDSVAVLSWATDCQRVETAIGRLSGCLPLTPGELAHKPLAPGRILWKIEI